MRVRNHGKYTNMRVNNPRAIGTCDYSGFLTKHSRLIKQMEYRGAGLVWTGFWVNPKFADKPNAQNLTPLIKVDPVPVPNARPDAVIEVYPPSISYIDVSAGGEFILPADNVNYLNFQFQGTPTTDVVVKFPVIFNEFWCIDKTDSTNKISICLNVTDPVFFGLNKIENTLFFCDAISLTKVTPN